MCTLHSPECEWGAVSSATAEGMRCLCASIEVICCTYRGYRRTYRIACICIMCEV